MRNEPVPAPSFRKNPEQEAFLENLNSALASFQEQQYEDCEEAHPTLFIIGAPRSGTTLMSQLISSHLNIGYINNLIAAFWRAPCFGIRLSQKLLSGRRPTSYQSTYGRTSEIHEPHEFGYFWSELLNYSDMAQKPAGHKHDIDWRRVRKVLLNISREFQKPVVFKPFLATWHLVELQEALSRAYFIWVRRDPIDNGLSILHAREQFLGTNKDWFSLKPRECVGMESDAPCLQVAAQVYYIERSIQRQIAAIDKDRIIEIQYETLCRQPQQELNRISEHVRNALVEIQIGESPVDTIQFSPRSSRGDDRYREMHEAYEWICRNDASLSLEAVSV